MRTASQSRPQRRPFVYAPPTRCLTGLARRSPHGRRQVINRIRIACVLRRHLALPLVEIKRSLQFILAFEQFPEPRLVLERLAELLLVIGEHFLAARKALPFIRQAFIERAERMFDALHTANRMLRIKLRAVKTRSPTNSSAGLLIAAGCNRRASPGLKSKIPTNARAFSVPGPHALKARLASAPLRSPRAGVATYGHTRKSSLFTSVLVQFDSSADHVRRVNSGACNAPSFSAS